MTSPPSRRTVLRTAAWTAPAVAALSAAPALAASPGAAPIRVDVVGRRNGGADYTVTNLRTAGGALAVRMIVPQSQPESTFDYGDTASDWSVGGDGTSFFLDATVLPSATTGVVTLNWTLRSGQGSYTVSTSADGQTVTTTLPWAAPAARRAPAPATSGQRTRFGTGA